MKLGICLPQVGEHVDGDTVREVAVRAEEMGYDSLWVQTRLMAPLEPQTPYPASPDGSLPPQYANVLDPLETLTFAAAVTKRIKLGTSVLVYAYQSPVDLAKRIATLDVLSGGRVLFGLGLGWSKDEYDVSGTPFSQRGARMDEYIQCLKAIWGPDPVEFKGEFYQVARSKIGPKPVQKPHPPLTVAAFSPGAMQRVAALGDGWNAVAAMPFEQLMQAIQGVKVMARQAGRNGESLQFPTRVFPMLTEQEQGEDRQPFAGTLAQLKRDVERAEAIGVTEVIIETNFLPDVKGKADYLRYLEVFRELA